MGWRIERMLSYIGRPMYLLRQKRRKLRLQRKYGRLPPGLYYDRRIKSYVHSELIDWAGMPLELLFAELARTKYIYEFDIGGSRVCEGTFEAVLLNAYECAALFSIPDEVKCQYSAQQLELLQKLVERGRRDRERASAGTSKQKEGEAL